MTVKTATDPTEALELLELTDNVASHEFTLKVAPLKVVVRESQVTVTIELEGDTHTMTEHAVRQLAGVLGIPTNYALKCPVDLLTPQITYWQSQLSEQKRVRAVIAEDEIQGITSPNFIPTRSKLLIDKALSLGAALDWFEHDYTYTRAVFSFEEVKVKPTPGSAEEVTSLGIHLTNSMTNDHKTELMLSVVREKDGSRLVVPVFHDNPGPNGKQMPGVRLDKDEANAEDWLERETNTLKGTFPDLNTHLSARIAETLTPEQVMCNLEAQKKHIPGPLREFMDSAYADDPIPSMYGIALAVAHAALDVDTHPPAHRLTGEQRAGHLIADDDCDTCSRPFHA